MGDDATIEGKAGPKSVKMAAAKAAADGEDIEGYNQRLAFFAKSLVDDMGVELHGMNIH